MHLNRALSSSEVNIWIIFFILNITLFLAISISMKRGKLDKIDRVILSKFQSIKSPLLDTIFEALTWFGSLKILTPLILGVDIFLIELNHLTEAIVSNLIIAISILSVYLFKYLFKRDRPTKILSDPSFPSAHTLQVSITFFIIWLLALNIGNSYFIGFGVYLILLSFAVAISRLYLQVHYPSDVLGGFILAILFFGISFLIFKLLI